MHGCTNKNRLFFIGYKKQPTTMGITDEKVFSLFSNSGKCVTLVFKRVNFISHVTFVCGSINKHSLKDKANLAKVYKYSLSSSMSTSLFCSTAMSWLYQKRELSWILIKCLPKLYFISTEIFTYLTLEEDINNQQLFFFIAEQLKLFHMKHIYRRLEQMQDIRQKTNNNCNHNVFH